MGYKEKKKKIKRIYINTYFGSSFTLACTDNSGFIGSRWKSRKRPGKWVNQTSRLKANRPVPNRPTDARRNTNTHARDTSSPVHCTAKTNRLRRTNKLSTVNKCVSCWSEDRYWGRVRAILLTWYEGNENAMKQDRERKKLGWFHPSFPTPIFPPLFVGWQVEMPQCHLPWKRCLEARRQETKTSRPGFPLRGTGTGLSPSFYLMFIFLPIVPPPNLSVSSTEVQQSHTQGIQVG